MSDSSIELGKITLSALIALLLTGFQYYVPALIVLVLFIVIDYLTGMAAAAINGGLSSQKGIIGIIKKICYMGAVCVGFGVDFIILYLTKNSGMQFDYPPVFGMIVTIFLTINELLSITENLGRIGVPLPKFLVKVVTKLKELADEKEA